MSEKRKFSVPLPALAIVVLVVGYLVATQFTGPKVESAAPAPVEDAGEPTDDAPAPEPEPDVKTNPDLDVGPIVTPTSSTWPTYHGDPTLSGLSDATLPDQPAVLWRKQVDGGIYTTPVADEQRMYFAEYKGVVHAVDFEGGDVWTRRFVRETRADGKEMMARIDAPLAVFEGKVFLGLLSGMVHALDASNGKTLWSHDLDGTILGTPNLHQREGQPAVVVMLRQDDGLLIGLDLESGERLWEAEGPERCDGSVSISDGRVAFGSCAAAVHLRAAADGGILEDIRFDEDSQVAGGVVFAGNSLFSGSHSGRVFHVHSESGEVVWMNEDAQDEISSTPALTEDTLVFGSYDEHVYAVDRKTGTLRWKYEAVGLPTSPVVAGGKVVFGVDGILHMASMETGEILWSYEVSDEIASPAIIDGRIVVGSEDGTVTAFGAGKPE